MAAGRRRRGTDAAGPFTAEQTHGDAFRPGARLHADSGAVGWRSVHAQAIGLPAHEVSDDGIDGVCLTYSLGRPTDMWHDLTGARRRETYGPRRFAIVPDGQPIHWKLGGPIEEAHVYLRRGLVDRVAVEAHDAVPARVAILPRFGFADPLLEQLTLNLVRAMPERPPGHALHADRFARAVAAHLVQYHSILTRPVRVPEPDGLVDRRLRRLADYIEAPLGDGLSLEGMAGQAGLSPLYLVWTFKRAFGEPPHRYLVRRRIERAKELLRATDLPSSEVALACGFATQSHLSEAFRRGVGTTPGAYRKGAT